MKDINTNKEYILIEKSESRCSFMNIFQINDYNILLRLDWDDIKNGDPVLDAQIWKEGKNNKKIWIKEEKDKWHHNERKIDIETGLCVYIFKYDKFVLKLSPKKTMGKKFTIDAILVPSVEIKRWEIN